MTVWFPIDHHHQMFDICMWYARWMRDAWPIIVRMMSFGLVVNFFGCSIALRLTFDICSLGRWRRVRRAGACSSDVRSRFAGCSGVVHWIDIWLLDSWLGLALDLGRVHQTVVKQDLGYGSMLFKCCLRCERVGKLSLAWRRKGPSVKGYRICECRYIYIRSSLALP